MSKKVNTSFLDFKMSKCQNVRNVTGTLTCPTIDRKCSKFTPRKWPFSCILPLKPLTEVVYGFRTRKVSLFDTLFMNTVGY